MAFFHRFRRFSGGMEPVLPLWLPIPRLVRARRARDELRRLIGDLIRRRRAEPLDPPDFLQTYRESDFERSDPLDYRAEPKWDPVYEYLIAHYRQVDTIGDMLVLVPNA